MFAVHPIWFQDSMLVKEAYWDNTWLPHKRADLVLFLQEFCEHTQTIGHRMKQRKYDQQQQMKFADNRGPGQWGDNYGPGRWGDNRGLGRWGDNRGPGQWGDNRGPGRWTGGPPDHERQPPPQAGEMCGRN